MKKFGILFSVSAVLAAGIAFAMSDTPEETVKTEATPVVEATPVAKAPAAKAHDHAAHAKPAAKNAPVMMMSPLALEALRVKDDDYFEGAADAPVTIIEYLSLTCGHCANFHNNIYPAIKKKYVDTGKVRFVTREMAWGNLATAVAKVIRCVPDDQKSNMLSLFFKTQDAWSKKDQLNEIRKVARMGGLTGEKVDACIRAEDTQMTVISNTKTAQETLGVTATPSFFVGNMRFRGVQTVEELSVEIEKQLNK